MIRNRRAASAAAALAIFAGAGVCGVIAVRVVRAVSETLTQQTPAHTTSVNTDGGARTNFTTTVNGSLYSLQVDVDPARTGSNSIHLYAYTPDKKPQTVVAWTGTAGLPEKGIEPIAIPLLAVTDNHAVGLVSLPAPGGWQLSFTVRTSAIDQATVSVTVPVRK
jgi:copper transport protein